MLHTLLLRGASGRRMWASLAAMAAGLSLLLIAVSVWWNFDQLLKGRASDDSLGSTFLTISRRVTDASMGHPEQTVFSRLDIQALKSAPQVEDVGVVQSLMPQAYMSMQIMPGAGFSTVMVLESVPDRFMDKRPSEWSWQPGSSRVPVILSSSFLSLYNYAFAPSQGLPQLSEESIKALPFTLSVGEGSSKTDYIAQIAGFSDRITSVLVPESFIEASNRTVAGTRNVSRLIIKVKDPSATEFADYLESHGYVTNSEMLRWSKMRAIVNVVAIVLGVLAALLLGISLLVFVLFIELTVSRAQHSVQLLQEIGYSPKALNSFLNARFLPLFAGAVFFAVLFAAFAQLAGHYIGENAGLHFARIAGWPVWVCAAAIAALLVMQMRLAIAAAMRAA